jgi:hypothetical protein
MLHKDQINFLLTVILDNYATDEAVVLSSVRNNEGPLETWFFNSGQFWKKSAEN